MSLIARCPACQTWYKVVPDQLRISDGWVRCGQCGEIFDASQQLIESEAEPTPDPTQPDEQVLQHLSMVADTALHDDSIGVAESVTVAPPRSSVQETLINPSAPESWQPIGLPEKPWESAALLIKPSSEIAADFEGAAPSAPDQEPMADSVSFMRAPDVRQDTRQKGTRLLWGMLSIVLLLGLLVQGLYRERDQLAALKPEIKPAVQSFCEVVGCRVSSLQRIDAFVLDSATFQQVDQETFQLHLVVKNKTQLALALPTIELTLTDLTDQPVMRRVLTPAELGAKTERVSAAGEWSATAYLRVKADTARPRALGYRLLVFYP